MDQIKVGAYIKRLRVENNLTQKELSDKLCVSHQAISKWENGESLPDVGILLDLSDILGTTVDNILHGGIYVINKKKHLKIQDILEGFECFKKIKNIFGPSSLFYKGMIEGINNIMNFDFEDGLNNHLEIMVGEVILQSIKNEKCYIEIEEVNNYFTKEKLKQYIIDEMKKENID